MNQVGAGPVWELESQFQSSPQPPAGRMALVRPVLHFPHR